MPRRAPFWRTDRKPCGARRGDVHPYISPSGRGYTSFVALFPVFLDLTGERTLVVGGGSVALRRARNLLGSGARVTVVAPRVRDDLARLGVTVVEREFEPQDLAGVRVVFACTDDVGVNDLVAREARARGVWCSHASRPSAGDVRLGASFAQGDVQVSVTTGASLPYLAQALRDRLQDAVPVALPVEAWAARREAALTLPVEQRELVLATLKAEIDRAVRA